MRLALLLLPLLCAACSTAAYRTPGGPAPLADIGRSEAQLLIAQPPSPRFPVRLSLVRVQAPAYQSFSGKALGSGRYSVLPVPGLPDAQPLAAVASWPKVAAAAPLDLTLLPSRLESLEDLRLAAAKTQADVLMVYTLDTAFARHGEPYAPRAELKLDPKSPPQDLVIQSQALALFIDVRTGYQYAQVQARTQLGELTAALASAAALDDKRREAEQAAFAALLQQAQQAWNGIASRYEYAQLAPAGQP
ncbi:hypothetical protein SAMN04488038_11531 [Solimonas aquatica]|uniref:Uncharacterized protein n=1 Tax=Solimonas aquatica TaxID=489703 RepID=A0A1H9L672_9GAMM|nr:hypothetical protein [Solimonas aquatica]SER06818.1 hypothetical protein SAMN04488038_11531 [Solimonas aquatica]